MRTREEESTTTDTGPSYDSMEEGFLYKPQAESSGNLVILLPSKYRDSRVVLKDAEGNVLEEGRSSGYANGDREHFRFSQSGSKYPKGVVVEMTLSDGSVLRHQIEDPSMRYDMGGASSGAIAGKEGVMGGITMPESRPIEKPGVSSKFTQQQRQAPREEDFKMQSPLSQYETIKTLSNLIIGASRNFNNMRKAIGKDAFAEIVGHAAEFFPTEQPKGKGTDMFSSLQDLGKQRGRETLENAKDSGMDLGAFRTNLLTNMQKQDEQE